MMDNKIDNILFDYLITQIWIWLFEIDFKFNYSNIQLNHSQIKNQEINDLFTLTIKYKLTASAQLIAGWSCDAHYLFPSLE